MTQIEQYQLALFTQQIKPGDKNPPGEATYLGYSRVPVSFMNGKSVGETFFPTCQEDYPTPITHMAVMTYANEVKHVFSADNLVLRGAENVESPTAIATEQES